MRCAPCASAWGRGSRWCWRGCDHPARPTWVDRGLKPAGPPPARAADAGCPSGRSGAASRRRPHGRGTSGWRAAAHPAGGRCCSHRIGRNGRRVAADGHEAHRIDNPVHRLESSSHMPRIETGFPGPAHPQEFRRPISGPHLPQKGRRIGEAGGSGMNESRTRSTPDRFLSAATKR